MTISLTGNTGTAVEAPILASHQWHRYETTSLAFTVTDAAAAAVNLSALSLQWLLLRQGGDAESRAYINKTSASISGSGSSVATFAIDDSDFTATILAGYYQYEFWDRTNDRLLAYGDAVLLHGTQDEA